jgi:hypothetical protein
MTQLSNAPSCVNLVEFVENLWDSRRTLSILSTASTGLPARTGLKTMGQPKLRP